MHRIRTATAVAALTLLAFTSLVQPARAAETVDGTPAITRLAGSDRYATAAAISAAYAQVGNTVYIASGATAADALAAGPAATYAYGSLLLTAPTSLPAATIAELVRIRPTSIVVLGGTGAVSTGVETALQSYAPIVRRIGGPNRYATAADIAGAWNNADRVFLAEGTGFADALSAGAAAGVAQAPLLLTSTTSLAPETSAVLKRLHPSVIYVIGGTGVVSDAVAKKAAAIDGSTVIRVAGADRYATSAAIADEFFSETLPTAFANGSGFADALAGSPLAARQSGPLILTRQACLPSPSAEHLSWYPAESLTVFGGVSVIANSAATKDCNPPVRTASTTVLSGTMDMYDNLTLSLHITSAGKPVSTGTYIIQSRVSGTTQWETISTAFTTPLGLGGYVSVGDDISNDYRIVFQGTYSVQGSTSNIVTLK
jgi:hypothetical protein